MKRLLRIYTKFKPFTEDEAWMLFKLAAFGEAVGWTLLITGILLSEYVFPGNRIPVVLAGRTHGALFGLYLTAILVLSPSLQWKWKRMLIAGIMSVPPYGTLLFEICNSQYRSQKHLVRFGLTLRYQQIIYSLQH